MQHDTAIEADVYPVGLLADLIHFRGRWKHESPRRALARLRRDLLRGTRRNYWNGFLAESGHLPHAGHGWTRRRALRDLGRIAAHCAWAQHTCGQIRLIATDRRNYCTACNTSSRRGWTLEESR